MITKQTKATRTCSPPHNGLMSKIVTTVGDILHVDNGKLRTYSVRSFRGCTLIGDKLWVDDSEGSRLLDLRHYSNIRFTTPHGYVCIEVHGIQGRWTKPAVWWVRLWRRLKG